MYHYHFTTYAPYTLGCFGGPNRVTTLQDCFDLYPDYCGEDKNLDLGYCNMLDTSTKNANQCCIDEHKYKLWCMCYEKPDWLTSSANKSAHHVFQVMNTSNDKPNTK